MSLGKNTVSRDASDKAKGLRMQKLRAVKMMIESANFPENSIMYWATELFGDVYQRSDGKEYSEEDKNYDFNTSFTFNSQILRKTLVIFCDLWINNEYSERLYFGFYATNNIGKENVTDLTKELNINLTETPLLEIAKSGKFDENFLSNIKKYIIYEYEEQYKAHIGKGYLNAIKSWGNDQWISFLKRIAWIFGQSNEKELDEELKELIKNCKWYSGNFHKDKEEFIKSRLTDLLDERQNNKDHLDRFVSKAEVELIFWKLRSEYSIKDNDPIWEMWNKLPVPTDKRNVREKLTSVCNAIDENIIYDLSVKAIEGGIERLHYEKNKDFLSCRYRIYRKCNDILIEELKNYSVNQLSKEIILEIIDKLKQFAFKEIDDYSESYRYPIKTETTISNLIIELFDSCYLAFDNGR